MGCFLVNIQISCLNGTVLGSLIDTFYYNFTKTFSIFRALKRKLIGSGISQ